MRLIPSYHSMDRVGVALHSHCTGALIPESLPERDQTLRPAGTGELKARAVLPAVHVQGKRTA